MMEHIAIMDKPTIDKIINGQKLIESRFSKNKITPYHNIEKDDTVYLKKSGGDITASFKVKDVIFFENLDKNKIEKIKDKYNALIKAPLEFWNLKKDSRYATLIFIRSPKFLKPISIVKKNRQAFVSCNSIKELFKINNI
jgi:hypothetical protein